ncbi:hypothetical protein PG985_009842 [Apiospora marii]|uniref:uncharacterized protein n=1 Tax=Apiospora marii TaxID=335849 RepID=UPI00312E9B27
MSAPQHDLPAPRRIVASNLPLPAASAGDAGAEPGVEVKVDALEAQPILGGSLVRYIVGTNTQVPTSNDGHGTLPIANVPGMGIVLPNGTHMYYIDVAPNTEGVMHRTTSADYLVVLQGTLSLMTPGAAPYVVRDGKPSYGEPVQTECRPGEVVLQRGMMHAISNRTSSWARVLGIVLDAKPNRVPIVDKVGEQAGNSKGSSFKVLEDRWLA